MNLCLWVHLVGPYIRLHLHLPWQLSAKQGYLFEFTPIALQESSSICEKKAYEDKNCNLENQNRKLNCNTSFVLLRAAILGVLEQPYCPISFASTRSLGWVRFDAIRNSNPTIKRLIIQPHWTLGTKYSSQRSGWSVDKPATEMRQVKIKLKILVQKKPESEVLTRKLRNYQSEIAISIHKSR